MGKQRAFVKFFFIIFLVVLCADSFARGGSRKMKITGRVVDITENPVINAQILVDGRQTGSTTNLNGKYLVKVDRESLSLGVVIAGKVVSADLIEGRSKIDFKINLPQSEPATFRQNSVQPEKYAVNTGYGNIDRRFATNRVEAIDGQDRKFASYSSVNEMLSREVSDIRYINGKYIIQNSRNMNGFVPALLIVDGTYVNTIEDISPSSVESISVLKGTSAAIYGSRGYGGAIVITTKIH